ncbi:sensor histidine kinase [Sphingobium agri]|uniref:Histidine kinase n=1 Tax=Sphingobium agri TaxID=2933566 RepID=A0ABT0DZK3_9SPHN|nr:histidine kinase [Sphingobium agri]MCK0532538.1 histidine kinase [Sphingobium agri]
MLAALRRSSLLGRLRVGADPEWLISAGRLVTVLFAALAIYLDPTRPAGFLAEAHLLLASYIAFSLWLALTPPRWPLESKLHLIIHGIDLLALGALVYLTDELSSPFFPFLPFILLATTLRWDMLGAVLGAVVMQLLLVALGWQDLQDGESELNLLIMRSAYFLVAAAMLGYFGACRARSSHRFAQLASWYPAPAPTDRRLLLSDMLRHASELLGVSQVLLLWQNQKGSGGTVALWGAGGLRIAEIDDPSFWRARSPKREWKELFRRGDAAELDAIAAAAGWEKLSADPAGVRSAPVGSAGSADRLFVIGSANHHEETQHLTQITALRIGHELERWELIHAIADNARGQERIRLARDLHDSVLQELTAASLKLKAAGMSLPEGARGALDSVASVMAEQQRRIRLFVEGSRDTEAPPVRLLSLSLAQSADELADQWGCDIALSIDPPDMEASGDLHRELRQLLSEATANAVRHGGATRLSVELNQQDDALRLTISDNGCGMVPASGRKPGWPRSLRARIRDLGGRMDIMRYAPGLAMRIEVPLQ